ncbi:MAG TPA: hypothetical protein VEC35_04330 [Noviherbaspirillum sp.]|nr:hypothetical protein [Noviherbaspirillum sp.]
MKRHRFLLAALSASAALLLAACGGGSGGPSTTVNGASTLVPDTNILPQAATGVPFEHFSPALSQTAITEKRTVVARDADAWQKLWAEHAGTGIANRPLPPVDFSKNMVIGVYLGASGACDGLSIEAVKKKEGPAHLEVTWKHTPPPPDIACIAVVVNRAVLATVPKSELPVEFVQAPADTDDALVIRSGWSFGMCLENCEGQAEIRQDGATLTVKRRKDPNLPEASVWDAVSAKEWEALTASFQTLPDMVIGCPDCADEGREWIEVEHKGSKKRVDISCNVVIPEAQRFQESVRAIRSRLAVALGLPEICNPGAIDFERIEPTVFTSEITDKRFVAVRDAAAWTALWNEHTGGRVAVPAIDFSQKMVAGVFIGRESVPCGSTAIESVRRRNNPDRIEVGYRITDPGPNVMCIAAVLNQYSLVTLPVSSLPVEFVKLP